MAPLLEPPRGQERHGKPSIFMKFHVFHGSGLFNAEAQRRRGFLRVRMNYETQTNEKAEPCLFAKFA
jgi:hypothetical protein